MRARTRLLAAGAAALAASAAVATALAGPGTVLPVSITEFKIAPAKKVVPAGQVTLTVRNTGAFRHGMIVIRTTTPAAKLRVNNGIVDSWGEVTRVRPVAPGAVRRVKLTLRRGHYALVCSLGGHYESGAHADLDVR